VKVWTKFDLESALGVATKALDFKACGVSTDSRTMQDGNVFVCLVGEKFDAHDYVADIAPRAGAIVAAAAREATFRAIGGSCPIIYVNDTLEALWKMGSFARSELKCKVLGVAGSNGKTSTKDMLFSMARSLVPTARGTRGNLNNHIGLPLTLANIPTSAGVVILEMGMNHAGELSVLSKIARPTHAIVTSVAEEHAEFFNSIEDIARAELEIVDGMSGGSLLYHADSPAGEIAVQTCARKNLTLQFYRTSGVRIGLSGIEFDFHGRRIRNGRYFSHAMAENLFGALSMLAAAGFTDDELEVAAAKAEPEANRRFQVFRKVTSNRQTILIDDSYNANQASFEAAIRSLREILPQGRLVLFAGEMAELGEKSGPAHEAVGLAAAQCQFESVLASGSGDAGILLAGYRAGFKEGRTLLRANPLELLQGFEPDEFDGILVKGSRRARMDLVSDEIKKSGFAG